MMPKDGWNPRNEKTHWPTKEQYETMGKSEAYKQGQAEQKKKDETAKARRNTTHVLLRHRVGKDDRIK